MKTILLGAAIAAAGLGLAIANRAELGHATAAHASMGPCVVPVALAPGYRPRAALAVENRRGARVEVWLEARAAAGLPRVRLGTVASFATATFPQALPAGRNVVTASNETGQARAFRQILDVVNRGPETCTRRYLWRID